jgi:hypothetical protein
MNILHLFPKLFPYFNEKKKLLALQVIHISNSDQEYFEIGKNMSAF